ncbi:MAG TPA: TIGR00730 family Rossman fold protein [Nitrospiria bacterium]|jgi:hypothetical protein
MVLNHDFDHGTLDDHVMRLIEMRGGSPNSDLLKEMILTVLKFAGDQADRGDLKILNSALKELRYAFKVFRPFRKIRKVSVFGSARVGANDKVFHQARLFSEKITELGFMVITGAGEGIMKAAQGGAGREKSFGVNIRLPFEQYANEYIENDPKLVTFKYFFTRKLIFIKETDGVVLFPGGFGTHDEAFEALTLIQTGKSNLLPVVFLDEPGGIFWKEGGEYIREHLLNRGLISEEDMALFKVTDSVDEAVDEVVHFYRNYHSSRFVQSQLVLRLHYPVNDELLERLNIEFKDILNEGKISRSSPFPEEINEENLSKLNRLAFTFNRKDFGRLRQMIDLLNQSIPE